MDGVELYSLWVEAMAKQGVGVDDFDELSEDDRQAWRDTAKDLRHRSSQTSDVAEGVKDLLDKVAEKHEHVRILEYSGRNMMGKQCLAMTGRWRQCQIFLADVLQTADNEAGADREKFHDLIEDLMIYAVDDLGHDKVVYWPNLMVPFT